MSSVLASLRHDSYWRVRAALGVGKVWIQRAELFQQDPGGGAEGRLIYWTVGVALGVGVPARLRPRRDLVRCSQD